jgi:hypothetical protein
MIPRYTSDVCRAGGEHARRDDGFDVVRELVDVVGVEGLETFVTYVRSRHPKCTRAEFTRHVVALITRDPYMPAVVAMRAAA